MSQGSILVAGVPVDTDFFRPVENLLGRSDEFTILNVGGVGPRKGGDLLLEVVSAWYRRYGKTARFVVVGTGPYADGFRKFEAGCPIFTYLGIIDERTKLEWMNRASAYLSTSRDENYSVAAAEAIACGLPVVSTDLPGPRDFLKGGSFAELVSGGYEKYIAALARIRERWAANPSAFLASRRELASRARSTLLKDESSKLSSLINKLAAEQLRA